MDQLEHEGALDLQSHGKELAAVSMSRVKAQLGAASQHAKVGVPSAME